MDNCANCCYFEKRKEEKGGECHRMPPVPVIIGERIMSMWVLVMETALCGEYRRNMDLKPKLEVVE